MRLCTHVRLCVSGGGRGGKVVSGRGPGRVVGWSHRETARRLPVSTSRKIKGTPGSPATVISLLSPQETDDKGGLAALAK